MADHTTDNEFGKGVTYAAPIDLNAKKPLDSRVCVATLAERDEHFDTNRCYPGMPVYVAETGLTYVYDGYETEGGVDSPVWLVLADRAWVSQQIVEAGGMTEEAVRLLVEQILAQHEEEGKFDDIKVYDYGPRILYTKSYATSAQFPVEGDVSLIYYDENADVYYKWNGGTYVVITNNDYKKYFPTTGIQDVQYIDKYQDIEYIWNGSAYEVINKVATSSEIENMFNN